MCRRRNVKGRGVRWGGGGGGGDDIFRSAGGFFRDWNIKNIIKLRLPTKANPVEMLGTDMVSLCVSVSACLSLFLFYIYIK